MHDYFNIIGISDAAPVDEIRRALRRHPVRSHPDFSSGDRPSGHPARHSAGRESGDVAIDFVDMSAIVDRMQSAFFSS